MSTYIIIYIAVSSRIYDGSFLMPRTPGSRTHRGIAFCRPLRGLRSLLALFPRFEDSPGATFCRPLRGLIPSLCLEPPVRGLTGGYILSPATRARPLLMPRTPGSRTDRGIAFCRPLRGLRSLSALFPRFEDSPGYILSPATRARPFLMPRTPGSRTHRGLHSVARYAGSSLPYA